MKEFSSEPLLLEKFKACVHADRYDDAMELVRDYVEGLLFEVPEAYGPCFDGYCRILLCLSADTAAALTRIEALCSAAMAKQGPQPWSSLALGCVAFQRGDQHAASAHFRSAAKDDAFLWFGSIGCRTFRPVDSEEDGHAIPSDAGRDFPTLSFDDVLKDRVRADGGTTGGVVFLVSCDESYLKRHGPAFLASLEPVLCSPASDAFVHVILINGGAETFQTLRSGLPPIAQPRVSMSQETWTGHDPRTYYASSRFLHASEILEAYGRPLLISDIDAVYVPQAPAAIKALRDHDVVLRLKKASFRHLPWQTIQAGLVWVAPTESGRRFMDLTSSYIRGVYAEQPEGSLHFLDQNALFAAHHRMRSQADFRCGDFLSGSLPRFIRFRQEWSLPDPRHGSAWRPAPSTESQAEPW